MSSANPHNGDQVEDLTRASRNAILAGMAQVVIPALQLVGPGEIHVCTIDDVPVLVLGDAVAIPFEQTPKKPEKTNDQAPKLPRMKGEGHDLVDVARRFQAAADVLRAEVSKRFPDV